MQTGPAASPAGMISRPLPPLHLAPNPLQNPSTPHSNLCIPCTPGLYLPRGVGSQHCRHCLRKAMPKNQAPPRRKAAAAIRQWVPWCWAIEGSSSWRVGWQGGCTSTSSRGCGGCGACTPCRRGASWVTTWVRHSRCPFVYFA